MTYISQNRPIITFDIKELFRANEWIATLTIYEQHFSTRRELEDWMPALVSF